MGEIENYKNWLEKQGLSKNPFTLEINPSLLVGYEKQITSILKNIEQRQKLILISGATGSGKTSLITYLISKNNKFIFLSKPPRQTSQLINISDEFIKELPLFTRIFIKKPKKIEDVPQFLNNIIREPKVLYIDEIHEASIEVLEWLRIISDQVQNLSIIFSGLPVFDEILTKNLETLKKRIIEKIELNALTKEETEQLIRKRIEYVGGRGIKPFTPETIDYIYNRTGGFPRDIIVLCNKLLNSGIENNSENINIINIKEKPEKIEKVNDIGKIKNLSIKQKKIIEIILEHEPITPNKLIEFTTEYPSEKHALRAVNNLLKRLAVEGYVERKKSGKTYTYNLTPLTRTLLIKS